MFYFDNFGFLNNKSTNYKNIVILIMMIKKQLKLDKV